MLMREIALNFENERIDIEIPYGSTLEKEKDHD